MTRTGSSPEHRGRRPAVRPRWELRVDDDGGLTAVLTGSEPPITVTGAGLASLRRQIRNTMPRAPR